MDPRIRELAEQAGGHNNISKFRGHFLPPAPGYIDPATVDLEKFAELIVCECANLCDEEAKFAGSDGQKDASASNCANRIKEHFGVEQ